MTIIYQELMLSNNHHMTHTPLLDENDLPIYTPSTEVLSESSSISVPYYTFSDSFEPMSLFPDLPSSSTLGSSDTFEPPSASSEVGNFGLLWEMSNIEITLLPMLNDMTLNANNEYNTSFAYDDRVYFPNNLLGGQQEFQQQYQQQNNEFNWNSQLRSDSFTLEDPIEFVFPSPLSVGTGVSVEAPTSNHIILPESSKSAPLISNNSSNSSTCGRYRNQKQRKIVGAYCEICKKPFGRQQEVKRHLRIHSGLKSFQCQICLFSFSRKDALDRHHKTKAGRCGDRRPSTQISPGK